MNKTERIVLGVLKSLLSSTVFLLVFAAAILGSSIIVSLHTGQWHWFQRSGALVVGIGAILSTRRLLRIGLDGLIQGKTYFDIANHVHTINGQRIDAESECDLIAAYWGFVVVGSGTVIWAFGDLVECLLAQSMACAG